MLIMGDIFRYIDFRAYNIKYLHWITVVIIRFAR